MQWPLTDGHGCEAGVVNLLTSTYLPVTGGLANTKGAWVEMIASSSFPAAGLWIQHVLGIAQTSQNRSMLIDVGIGALGSERVLVPNVNVGFAQGARSMLIPIHVPVGSRISLRFANATALVIVGLQVVLANAGISPLFYAGTRATDYGTNTAESGGTLLTAATIINTKSAWTPITTGTTHPLRWLMPFITPLNSNAVGSHTPLIDIGVGASGSERVLIPNISTLMSTSEECFYNPISIPVNLPAGTRLSARYQTTAIATNTQVRVSLLGIG